MWLIDLLSGRKRNTDAIGRLAAQVANETHQAVWTRVSHRVLAMRLNEARGYVRARAAHCIQSQVEQVVRRNPQLNPRQLADLASRATDHVVGLVIRDVLVAPGQSASRRRAA
jgi:hypothetical protein